MSLVPYEVLGGKPNAPSHDSFANSLRLMCSIERAALIILYLVPVAFPALARSIDMDYNLVFPVAMGFAVLSFVPVSTRVARRFFDQDPVAILTPHSSMIALHTVATFVSSLRASGPYLGPRFRNWKGPEGEAAYRMLMLISYLFHESGRLINYSRALYTRYLAASQLVAAVLMTMSVAAYKIGLIPHPLLQRMFVSCGVLSLVTSLVDGYPSLVTVEKGLDILPLAAAGVSLLAAILGIEALLPDAQ